MKILTFEDANLLNFKTMATLLPLIGEDTGVIFFY